MIDFTNKDFFKLTKTDSEGIAKKVQPLLVNGEQIIGEYKSIRDFVVFTDRRIIVVDTQGLIGKKKEFSILPYSKIQAFSIETSDLIDLDAELELYYSSLGTVRFEFMGHNDIMQIGKMISEHIF